MGENALFVTLVMEIKNTVGKNLNAVEENAIIVLSKRDSTSTHGKFDNAKEKNVRIATRKKEIWIIILERETIVIGVEALNSSFPNE